MKAIVVWVSLWVALSAAHAELNPPWMATFQAQLTKRGTAALEYLRGQPDAVKKTADYQWALAYACQEAGDPEPAAMALVTYDILTRRKGRDVGGLRAWLAVQGQALLRSAAGRLAANDEAGAVRDFLHAAVCDQALIQQPAAGLRDSTGQQLVRLAHANPQKLEYWALLAGYYFHTAHLDASKAAMEHYLALDLDDYQRWRGGVWMSSINRALEKHRKLAEKLMKEADAEAAAAPPAPPEPTPEPTRPPQPTLEQKLEKHRELCDMDARVRDAENRLRELESHRRGGQTYVYGGRVGVIAYNQRQLAQDIEAQQKQLEDLKSQRDALE